MGIFEYGIIDKKIYIAIVIFFIIASIIILNIGPITGYSKSIDTYYRTMGNCAIKCGENEKLCNTINLLKGPTYNIINLKKKKCITNYWEISHIITHIFFGLFTNIYISLGFGITWELLESRLGAYNILDIGYNTIGFLIGHGLKKYFNKSKDSQENT